MRTPPDESTGEPVLLLDLLMGLSVAAGLVWSLYLLDRLSDPTLGLVFAAMVLALAASWVVRRVLRRRRRVDPAPLVIVFAVLASAGPFVGDGSGSWPLFLMSLVLVTSRFSPVVAGVQVVVVVLAIAGWYALMGRAPGAILAGTLGAAYVFGFGLVLAWLITAYARQQRRIDRLLTEVRHGMRLEHQLALEQERTRAARDLHDGLGHQLTLVTMNLQYAERMRDRDPGRSWQQVGEARAAAAEALAVMRRWVRALRPARAGDAVEDPDAPIDLRTSLSEVADRFRAAGLAVEVAVEPGLVLSRPVGVFAHRLVQEGLTNVLRHAAAARAQVCCQRRDDQLVLTVSDDGTGATAPPTPGFGLQSLQERAEALGGELVAGPVPEGFRLQARLP